MARIQRLKILDADYHQNALAIEGQWLVLFRRSGPPGSEPSESDTERIEVSASVASVEVTCEQLTVLPAFVWLLSGFVGALLLYLLIFAVQYPMGRRFATAFRVKLRDGRNISMTADGEVCRQIALAIQPAVRAA